MIFSKEDVDKKRMSPEGFLVNDLEQLGRDSDDYLLFSYSVCMCFDVSHLPGDSFRFVYTNCTYAIETYTDDKQLLVRCFNNQDQEVVRGVFNYNEFIIEHNDIKCYYMLDPDDDCHENIWLDNKTGPAVEYKNNPENNEYWIEGKELRKDMICDFAKQIAANQL